MPTLTYFLKPKKNSAGESPIVLMYRSNYGQQELSTGYKVNKNHWNAKSDNTWIKPTYGTASIGLNNNLRKALNDARELLFNFQATEQRDPSGAELKELWDIKNERRAPKDVSFWGLWNEWADYLATKRGKNNITEGSGKLLKDAGRVLKLFSEFEGNDPLSWQHLDLFFYDRFVAYMTEEQEYMANTQASKIGYLRQFVIWAQEFKNAPIHKSFRATLRVLPDLNAYPFFLQDRLDLMVLPEMDVKLNDAHPMYVAVRDAIYLQSCLGCRYSDLAVMLKDNIVKEGGYYYIRLVTKKNNQVINARISVRATHIIDKYYSQNTKDWLPKYDDMIRFVKEVFRICGFTENWVVTRGTGDNRQDESVPVYTLVGTHTARRSFINNASRAGVAVPDIAAITRQKPETVMRYLQANTETINLAMDKIDRNAPTSFRASEVEPGEVKQN